MVSTIFWLISRMRTHQRRRVVLETKKLSVQQNSDPRSSSLLAQGSQSVQATRRPGHICKYTAGAQQSLGILFDVWPTACHVSTSAW